MFSRLALTLLLVLCIASPASATAQDTFPLTPDPALCPPVPAGAPSLLDRVRSFVASGASADIPEIGTLHPSSEMEIDYAEQFVIKWYACINSDDLRAFYAMATDRYLFARMVATGATQDQIPEQAAYEIDQSTYSQRSMEQRATIIEIISIETGELDGQEVIVVTLQDYAPRLAPDLRHRIVSLGMVTSPTSGHRVLFYQVSPLPDATPVAQ